MTKLFLKAKHWQLFILGFVLPFGTTLASFEHISIDESTFGLHFMELFAVEMLFFMGIILGWVWSIATGLQSLVPEGIKMKTRKFKSLFFIPIIYLAFILIYLIRIQDDPLQDVNGGLFALIIILVVLLHLFSMFCIFYSIYFAAKTLKIAEVQRPLKSDECIGEFFMIYFFPAGIWIIQPRVNKLIKDK